MSVGYSICNVLGSAVVNIRQVMGVLCIKECSTHFGISRNVLSAHLPHIIEAA